jgi:uncharacterized protein
MKFTQQLPSGINLIRRYGADYIAIGEQEIRSSCLITANSIEPWIPRSVEELRAEHLAALFALAPEVVVLSTGAKQLFPRAPRGIRDAQDRPRGDGDWRGLSHLQRTGRRGATRAGGDIAAGSLEGTRVKTQGEKVV